MGADPARTWTTDRSDGTDIVREGGRPSEQLERLLERAENGTHAAPHLAGVRTALMHYCGLQSCRHAKGRPRPTDRRTYRHSFLLPDGDVRVVWELEHNSGPGGVVRYAPSSPTARTWPSPSGRRTRPPGCRADRWNSRPAASRARAASPADGSAGLPEPPGSPGSGRPRESRCCCRGREGCRRAYTEGDSPDHAWRLLRRAANRQRARRGGPSARLTRRRRAHDHHRHPPQRGRRAAARCPGRCTSTPSCCCDGSEVSLWEIDHTRTPNGSPVCEVYGSRDAALDTAVRRIEAG